VKELAVFAVAVALISWALVEGEKPPKSDVPTEQSLRPPSDHRVNHHRRHETKRTNNARDHKTLAENNLTIGSVTSKDKNDMIEAEIAGT
jgi:hypothetical protein